jgi:hypothetical protein
MSWNCKCFLGQVELVEFDRTTERILMILVLFVHLTLIILLALQHNVHSHLKIVG